MRFRSAQHLRRPADIRAVRAQGRRFDCRAFTVWWNSRALPPELPAGASPPVTPAVGIAGDSALALPRVCVIASTAAVGHAVLRNRARRRLREVFRHHQGEVPPDCDLLLIARQAATTWTMPELERKFVEACRHLSNRARSAMS